MAGFWFFLPDTTEAALMKGGRYRWPAPLAGILSDVILPDHAVLQVLRAPALGSSGIAIYPVPLHGRLPQNPGYDVDRQTWRMVPGCHLQIGWLTDEPPKPDDLARRKQLDGRTATDECGNSWQIPVARARWNPRGALPTAYGFDDNDEPIVGVSAAYREFWDNACKLWDLIGAVTAIEGETLYQRFTDEHDAFCWQMIQDSLAINYRLDRHVLATLELIYPGWLGAEVSRLILNSICDCEAYRLYFDAQKKTESRLPPDGLDFGLGEPADIQPFALA